MNNKYIFQYSKKKRRKSHLLYILLPVTIALIFIIIFAGKKEEPKAKEDVKIFLGKEQVRVITQDDVMRNGLTIDWDLQNYISENAKKYKIGFGAIVVMDAENGDLLALWGKNRKEEDCTLPLNSYLAASIFKIVTATAALENGINPSSPVTYSGNPWTIYKGQLKDSSSKWSQQTTFGHAFAQSNNVVFAKIGMSLGEEPLFLNAMKFGFWKQPMRECWSVPSTVMIPESEYNIGELACGLNHTTLMSPVHAAEIVTTILNKGLMVSPRLIKALPVEKTRIVDEKVAEDLYLMMGDTIKSGTFARRFRSCSNDTVLKDIAIGAKSGSIDSKNPDGRLNWFVGYADHPSKGKIVIASMLLRDPYYWIKADEFARMIIKEHFKKIQGNESASVSQSLN